MSKITFLDPADAKYLATYGDDLYAYRGTVVARKKSTSTPTTTSGLARVHWLMGENASVYWDLTAPKRANWETYKTHYPNYLSAWNALVANNIRGRYPDIPAIGEIDDISSPPQTPAVPQDLLACYYVPLDATCVSWTNTYTTETYIEAFQFIPPGKKRIHGQPWKFINWAPSAIEHLLIPSHRLIAGAHTQVTIRALNPRGEVSAFAPFYTALIPPPPIPDFTAHPVSGWAPFNVQFCDMSSGVIQGRSWNFNDGSSSTQTDPLHSYDTYARWISPSLTLYGPGRCPVTHKKTAYIYSYGSPLPPPTWISFKEHRDNLVGASPGHISFTYSAPVLTIRTADGDANCGYLFQVSTPHYLDAKKVKIRWRANLDGTAFSFARVQIRDGSYARDSLFDFPDQAAILDKGVGVLQSLDHAGTFPWTEEAITVNTAAALEDHVTIMVLFQHRHNTDRWMECSYLRITDAADNVLVDFNLGPLTWELSGTHWDYGYTGSGP